MPIQHASLKVDEIILRPASVEDFFLVAIIRSTGDKLRLACLEPAELLEGTLGNKGTVDGITVKPSTSAGSWHVIGFLRLRKEGIDNLGSTAERKPMQAPSTFRERARSEALNATNADNDNDAIRNERSRCNGIAKFLSPPYLRTALRHFHLHSQTRQLPHRDIFAKYWEYIMILHIAPKEDNPLRIN